MPAYRRRNGRRPGRAVVVVVTPLVTVEDFERAGLLPVWDALNRTGWRWTFHVREHAAFLTFEAEHTTRTRRRLYLGPIICPLEGHFEQVFIQSHDGSGLTEPSLREVLWLDYPR